MTDEKKIRQLLAAFYNGDTTVEEEALLKDFFDNENLPECWKAERDVFSALHDTSDISLPEGLSERLEKSIDEHAASSETIAKETPKIRKLYVKYASIAAVILLCIGLFWVVSKPSPSKLTADTFSDPQEAEIVATKALSFVSNNLNKGFTPLDKAQKNVDKTNEVLKKLNLK